MTPRREATPGFPGASSKFIKASTAGNQNQNSRPVCECGQSEYIDELTDRLNIQEEWIFVLIDCIQAGTNCRPCSETPPPSPRWFRDLHAVDHRGPHTCHRWAS